VAVVPKQPETRLAKPKAKNPTVTEPIAARVVIGPNAPEIVLTKATAPLALKDLPG
jgi:hypothetical protein